VGTLSKKFAGSGLNKCRRDIPQETTMRNKEVGTNAHETGQVTRQPVKKGRLSGNGTKPVSPPPAAAVTDIGVTANYTTNEEISETQSNLHRFRSKQMTNLIQNYQSVEATIDRLLTESEEAGNLLAAARHGVAEAADLRAQMFDLAAKLQTERAQAQLVLAERDELAQDYESAKATIVASGLPFTVSAEHIQRLVTTAYECAVRIMASPCPGAPPPKLEARASSFGETDFAGFIEKIEKLDAHFVCIGWASRHTTIDAALFVSLHDTGGCLGFGVPFDYRGDVAETLGDCDAACGFSFPLIRAPVGPVEPYLSVFTRDQRLTWLLPFAASVSPELVNAQNPNMTMKEQCQNDTVPPVRVRRTRRR
jgi:hypothetical protein